MASCCALAGQPGKKPTKVAARKIARQARWQQLVEESETPSESEDLAAREQRLEEIKQRRDKADRWSAVIRSHFTV